MQFLFIIKNWDPAIFSINSNFFLYLKCLQSGPVNAIFSSMIKYRKIICSVCLGEFKSEWTKKQAQLHRLEVLSQLHAHQHI